MAERGSLRPKLRVHPPSSLPIRPGILQIDTWRKLLPLTQTQIVTAVAERAELSKADAKRALEALDQIVVDELGNAQKVRIGGLVQLTVRVKPAQKARKGRNPATGEEITIAAKPAAVDLRARPSRAPRRPCRRCRKRAGGSPPDPGAVWPIRLRPRAFPRGHRTACASRRAACRRSRLRRARRSG